MKKRDFIKYMANQSGYSQATSLEMVNVVFDCLTSAVEEHNFVDITGIGKFIKKTKKSRKSVDIQNIDKVREIPEQTTLCFKASRVIRDQYTQLEKKENVKNGKMD